MSAPRPYDPFARACPSRRLLDRIGDRWTVLLITTLEDGPRRFSELLRTVDGISQKMLTQTLRALERDGLVSRSVTASVPPRVDYELTDIGRTLLAPIEALKAWAEENMGEVLASREQYDQREG